MTPTDTDAPRAHVITRERLLDGSLAEAFRANAPPGYKIRSQAELDESLEQTLAVRPAHAGGDVLVFGYGSLMWNPALEHAGSAHARLHGYCRRFCLLLLTGRGSPGQPGVMLALDRGGSCHGLTFTLPQARAHDELRLLWRREMLSHAYEARWVAAHVGGERRCVLTFVVNRQSPRYLGRLPAAEIVHMLLTGEGNLGTSREYFEATLASLRSIGMRDSGLERLNGLLQTRAREPARHG